MLDDDKLIDVERILQNKNPALKKWLPQFVINGLKKIIHQDFVNETIYRHKDKMNAEFCEAIIEQMNITVIAKGVENIPKDGGVYLVCNHPLGGMDAMALVHILKDIRPDIKFIVNDILLGLKNLAGMFYGVNKHGGTAAESLKKVNELFAGDEAVFIFPAGLVSRKENGKVEDLEWKKTFVTRAKRNDQLIVPVFLDGELSNFFYRLSNFRKKIGIKFNIEMIFLVNELKKQSNKTINVYFGKPIDPSTMDKSKTDIEWAKHIKEKAYSLNKV